MGSAGKGKQAAAPEPPAPAAPPMDGRGARIARPRFVSAWLDLDLRPQCCVCKSQAIHPPAYVPACLAAKIAELAGGGDVDRAIDQFDERAGRLLSRHGVVCLFCVPKALAASTAANDEDEGESDCPMLHDACREPHPTLSALVPSSRLDGYLAYRAFVHDVERAEAWAGAASLSRTIQHAIYVANRRPVAPALPPALAAAPSALAAGDGAGPSSSSPPPPEPAASAAPAVAASGPSESPPRRPVTRRAAAAPPAPANDDDDDELKGDAGGGAAAPPAKRQRRQPAERRPVWESEKLARVLYQAYTCRVGDYDDGLDEEGAGSEEAGEEDEGEDLNEAWEKARRDAFETALAKLDEEGSGSSSDAESAEPAAAPAEEEGGGSAAGSEDQGAATLEELERSLRRGLDAALVGIRLDADADARRALFARAQHAGRERIRCLLLASSGILGAFERYVEANGRNPRSWGNYRKDRVEPRYSPILEACGLRLEDRTACAKAYADLCSCARVLQKLPGLARVVGDGVSPADFVSFVPLLMRAPPAAIGAIEKRLTERVESYKDPNGEPLVKMPKSVFRLRDVPAAAGEGGGAEEPE